MNKINMGTTASTQWYQTEQLVVTKLSGKVNSNHVQQWKESLDAVFKNIPEHTSFKMLVDLHGFEAESTEVHKEYRSIIPLLLADYGYRIGYLDMFPEATVELRNIRGIQCVAMANVHHNADKMQDYETRFSKPHEHYITEPDKAMSWIKTLNMKN
jgi:hypothetical protein